MKSRCIFDLGEKQRQLAEVEREAAAPEFYSDRAVAQRQMQLLSRLRGELNTWESLQKRVADLTELATMLDDTPDPILQTDVEAEAAAIEQELERQRFKLLLNGEHDAASAIISIHAGNGGTDAQDWVGVLQRAYMRWAGAHDYKVELLDEMPGEEAGIKSTTFSVTGPYAYGYLRGEAGAHRLIRLSPFDSAHRR